MSNEKVKQLKNALVGRTLIGEYVGNQEYQHLVLYPRVTLIFYAMIDNSSKAICEAITKTRDLLSTFGLDAVPLTQVGTFRDYESLC